MANEKQIKKWIKEMIELNPNDPNISNYFSKIEKSLSNDFEETKKILITLNAQELRAISGCFDVIAYALQENKLVQLLKELYAKYPDSDLHIAISDAENAMED